MSLVRKLFRSCSTDITTQQTLKFFGITGSKLINNINSRIEPSQPSKYDIEFFIIRNQPLSITSLKDKYYEDIFRVKKFLDYKPCNYILYTELSKYNTEFDNYIGGLCLKRLDYNITALYKLPAKINTELSSLIEPSDKQVMRSDISNFLTSHTYINKLIDDTEFHMKFIKKLESPPKQRFEDICKLLRSPEIALTIIYTISALFMGYMFLVLIINI
jgi:hypothetical protein